ncbi:lysylphosphatidylglycerol synthase domain-containing protein [Carnobacterium gallinarum]|uniref:lysylphosphatidylglycerol synthase domain-containing protein n=1 Tax=Carnobacterium gallinarum TaxID=2749 RepID=UPI00068CE32D|nr:lysylphosphatidylglycerol synthase domain-containing protein [Carnobacterium gallinarum]
MKLKLHALFSWFKKYETWFKVIFIVLILTFVCYETRSILADLKISLLKKSLNSQSWQSILLMTITGILSLLPMIGSDFVIVQLVPGFFSKRYILISGWITNTFANIAGIGGLVSAPLRMYFYGKSTNKKETALAVSKIELFLISGFCLQCFLTCLFLFIPNEFPSLTKYWPLVLLGSLLFPSLYITTRWRAKNLFTNFSAKQQWILFGASSFGWWFSFGAFALIGHLLNTNVSLLKLFIIFVVGSAIGMFSLVPGGLGTFDLFVLYGLTSLGTGKEVVIVWLIFYRFFAYVLPFLTGLLLFLPDLIKIITNNLKKVI